MTAGSRNIWFLLYLPAVFILTACSALIPGMTQTTQPATTTAQAVTSPETLPIGNQPVDYQLLSTVPPAVQSKLQTYKKSRGYLYFTDEKILAVLMGEQPTGGYAIRLNKIDQAGGTLIIETVEKAPKPGDMVTQAFTYPMVIIQLKEGFTAFRIKDSKGTAYQKLVGVQY